MAEKKDIILLLAGKTGEGKSSTGNSILLKKIFKSAASTISVTKEHQIEYGNVLGRWVTVIDTPGVGDTELKDEEGLKQVIDAAFKGVAACPDGISAVVVVFKYGRLSKEDLEVVCQLKAIYGSAFLKEYGILLLTYGDNYDEDNGGKNFQDWSAEQKGFYEDMRRECNDRVVLFNNKLKDQETQKKQINELFELVDQIHGTYTPEIFNIAKQSRDQVIAQKKAPCIQQNTIKETALIMDELKQINVDDPEAPAALEDLDVRTEKLHQDILLQDNGTDALKSSIQRIEKMKTTIYAKMTLAKSTAERKEGSQAMETRMKEYEAKSRENAEEHKKRLAFLDQELAEMKAKQQREEEELERQCKDTLKTSVDRWIDRIYQCTMIAQSLAGVVAHGMSAYRSFKGNPVSVFRTRFGQPHF